jgi:hypothetical protein
VNIAAAFDIKRRDVLPLYVSACRFDSAWFGRVFNVVDGDLSDYRPADGYTGSIIGLRFKLPHGINYTSEDRAAFCID